MAHHHPVIDEVDLFEYVLIIKQYIKQIGLFVLLSVVCVFGILFVQPNYYQTNVSFFILQDDVISSSAASFGGILSGMSVSQGTIDKYIEPILSSSRMSKLIQKDVKSQFSDPQKNVSLLLSQNLKLQFDRGIYVLNYRHVNPEITFLVVKSVLRNLELLNAELEISIKRKFITILDAPVKPTFFSSKPYRMYLLVTLTLSFVIASIGAIFIDALKPYYRRLKYGS